jgi:hypothetical protein
MKKLIFILITLSLINYIALGQEKLSVGLKGGIMISKLKFNREYEDFSQEQNLKLSGAYETEYKKYKIAPTLGLNLTYNVNKIFSFESGIIYEDIRSIMPTDGWRSGGSIGDTIFDVSHTNYSDNNLDYLTIPLLAKLSFGSNCKVGFTAGPYFSFLLKERHGHYSITRDNVSGDISNTITKDYKSFDFGLLSGLSCDIRIVENLLVSLNTEFHYGLIDVHKTNDIFKEPDIKIILRKVSFSMTFGLLYKI